MCSLDSLLASEVFYTNSMHIISIIGIPIHIFGAFVIIFKTPGKMASVKSSMLILHVSSAFFDVYLSLLTVPVFFLPTLAIYPRGLLQVIGVSTEVQLYLGMSSVAVTGASILLFFENRYNRLASNEMIRQSKYCPLFRFIYISFHYVQALTYGIPAFLHIPSPQFGKSLISSLLPCIPGNVLENAHFLVLSDSSTVFSLCIAYIVAGPVAEIFFFCVGITWRLWRIGSKSENTYKMQRQFFIALCLQVSVPFVVLLIPACYAVYAMVAGYFNQALNNLTFIFLALHGLLSTIVMLIVHKPYRQVLVERFNNKSRVRTLEEARKKSESRVSAIRHFAL